MTGACARCGGSGEVRHPRYGSPSCPEPTTPCPDCGGVGCDAVTVIELLGDDGTVTTWTVPEMTPGDVEPLVAQHLSEVIPCPDCDGGHVWVRYSLTTPSQAITCATCEGAGQIGRGDLWNARVDREADRFERGRA